VKGSARPGVALFELVRGERGAGDGEALHPPNRAGESLAIDDGPRIAAPGEAAVGAATPEELAGDKPGLGGRRRGLGAIISIGRRSGEKEGGEEGEHEELRLFSFDMKLIAK
jgi:hypothetical protein